MRKNIWKWGLFILLLAPVMTACKDDDEDDYNFRNDPHITQTVESRYPGAQIVEVERTYQGYEVQMWLNNGEVDMHLDLNYQWLYTEFEDKSTTYDVQLVNGTEVSFDSKGDWTEVDGKRSEVPAFFIPKEIKKQVNEMFPGEKITKIEKDSRKYEVELTNDVELKFDRKFNIREID